jgi:hypothetical protein
LLGHTHVQKSPRMSFNKLLERIKTEIARQKQNARIAVGEVGKRTGESLSQKV